jgi:hypothetical protein
MADQVGLNPVGLSVLDWARERLANCERIALVNTAVDRAGWLEDAAYWRRIIAVLERAGTHT